MVEIKGFHNSSPTIPTIHTIGMSTKLLVCALALTSILASIFALNEKKYSLQNQVSVLLAFMAILFCFFPLHLFAIS